MCAMALILSAQSTYKTNLVVQKTTPTLFLRGNGGVIDFNTGDITLTNSANKITFAGGDFDIGANNLLITGSVGTTAARATKIWATDIEVTNALTVNGVSIFSNPTFTTGISTPAITLNGTALTVSGIELNYVKDATSSIQTQLNGKQATLVSATNIKTVGGVSLLGSGDIGVGGTGTVTTVGVTTANGVSASVTNATSTPNMTFTLGAITPSSVAATGTVAGSNLSGTNTGDNATNSQYSSLVTNATHTGDATGSSALTVKGINGTLLSGLATGLLKITTGTGAASIASAGTDYLLPSGTAAKATILATARNINGVSFDGSAAITVPSNITPSTSGNILTSNGTLWTSAAPVVTLTNTATLTNKTLTSPKINEDVAVTSTATELNKLHNVPSGLTSTEIGYNDGVTSAIQTQLNNRPTTATVSSITHDSLTAALANATEGATLADLALKVNIRPDTVALITDDIVLALTDENKILTTSSATFVKITIPLNSVVAFPLGSTITIKMGANGIVGIRAASGVTIEAPKDSLTINTKWGWATLIKRATNKWSVFGHLED
jgi:hypothetical protein